MVDVIYDICWFNVYNLPIIISPHLEYETSETRRGGTYDYLWYSNCWNRRRTRYIVISSRRISNYGIGSHIGLLEIAC